MEQRRNSQGHRRWHLNVWAHPWSTHTEYNHPSALSPYGLMSRKFFFPRFPLQILPLRVPATKYKGRVSDALPSLHWVCRCVLLCTSAPWPAAHRCHPGYCPRPGPWSPELRLAHSVSLNRGALLLLRTNSHSQQWGPWGHSTFLTSQSTWGWLGGGHRKEGSNETVWSSSLGQQQPRLAPLLGLSNHLTVSGQVRDGSAQNRWWDNFLQQYMLGQCKALPTNGPSRVKKSTARDDDSWRKTLWFSLTWTSIFVCVMCLLKKSTCTPGFATDLQGRDPFTIYGIAPEMLFPFLLYTKCCSKCWGYKNEQTDKSLSWSQELIFWYQKSKL